MKLLVVPLLKLLTIKPSLQDISQSLGINRLQLIALIGYVNAFEPNLVNANNIDRVELTKPLEWLSSASVESRLAQILDKKFSIKVLDEVDSTNSYALSQVHKSTQDFLVVANWQSSGRGRGAKAWHTKIATDLAISIGYYFPLDFEFELLPLIMAVAVVRLLTQFKITAKIKWPNDILLENGEKIAGILVETGVSNNRRFAVIGIGLDNINHQSREALLCYLVQAVDNVIQEYRVFSFALLRQEWLDKCIHYHKEVAIYQNDKLINKGRHVDLSIDGGLILNSNGELVRYMSNQVSLRFCF
jgi:BirA family biotin operon repressor/biotin-[acetyl-CoA-carboxylase] ligase